MFNPAGVGNFASRGACSPAFSPIQYACRSSACAAVLCAMRVERRHTAHDKRRDCHHHKKPNRFEFSGHEFESANHTRFLRARPMS